MNEVQHFLDQYDDKRKAILANDDLSESGKEKRLAELEKEMQGDVRTLIKDLRFIAVTAGLTASEAAQGRGIEGQQAMKNLDYARLSYEAGRIKSLISGANDIRAIEDAWEKVKAGGDPYQLQAWKDQAPGVIRDRKEFNNSLERAGLLVDLEKTSVNHAGQTAIGQSEKQAVSTLEDVKAQAQAIEDRFGTGRGGVIKRVLDGIEATEKGVKTEFESQDVKRLNGMVEKESADEVYIRLEVDHDRKFEKADQAAGLFGANNPDPDGLRFED